MSGRRRFWMRIKTSQITTTNIKARTINLSDVSLLAELMDKAYTGTIDHEGEALEQCAEEIQSTINGKYGPFVASASNIIIEDKIAAAACMITIWKNKPLVAFSMTHPDFQRRGYGKALIELAITDLFRHGNTELFLVVTDGNTSAQNLYEKIGFENLGESLPKQAPPTAE